MRSKCSEDCPWFCMWDDGCVKKQVVFNTHVWKCMCKIPSV